MFLLALNLFLLVAGCLLDIFSAIVVLVPLMVPLGMAFGIDPIHLGIIFLVNMELGYLTPPVGMNLFFAAYRFGKPLPEVIAAASRWWAFSPSACCWSPSCRGSPPACRSYSNEDPQMSATPIDKVLLTAREIEVLRLIALGCTYAEAATRLGISPHTLASHIKNLYRKLDVHSAAAAVCRALTSGAIP